MELKLCLLVAEERVGRCVERELRGGEGGQLGWSIVKALLRGGGGGGVEEGGGGSSELVESEEEEEEDELEEEEEE